MSRKMVKWAPFVSLKEQTIYLNRLKTERQKVTKPLLGEDEMNMINETLVNYHGQILNITYYDKGYIKEINTVITKIDCTNKKVVTTDMIINFDDLIGLEE